MLTKGGVEKNLNITPFTYNYKLVDGLEFEFCFSSQTYLNKFVENMQTYIDKINHDLQAKYFCSFDMRLLGLLECYRRIEKRGFLVRMNGRKIEWLNTLTFGGESLMLKK